MGQAMDVQQVTLSGGPRDVSIRRDRVYFAFPSHRLEYDCVTCGAQCCRGHGYHLQAGRELTAHLEMAPSLRFFVDRCDAERESHYHVSNCAPACFFLTAGQQCGIQIERGYDEKPETCRLFPFNMLTCVGDYLVVRPHQSLCPLRVLPVGKSSELSSHAQLLTALTRANITMDAPTARPIVPSVDALIALERRVVDLSHEYTSVAEYSSFAVAQLREGAAAMRDRPRAGGVASSEPADVEQFVQTVRQLLGVPEQHGRRHDESVMRVLAAATPSLRADMVLSSPSDLWSAYAGHLALQHVPLALAVLHVLTTMAADAGTRPVTYQTAMGLYRANRGLIWTLAHLDNVMAWKSADLIGLRFHANEAWQSRYSRVVCTLLPSRQRRARARLGDIMGAAAPEHGLERLTFIKRLAHRLAGRIVPLECHVRPTLRQWLRAPRPALQHWAIGRLGTDAVAAVTSGR